MKRIFFMAMFACILLMCVCCPLLVLAERAGAMNTNISDYLSLREFGSFAGQVTFVVLMVQFIKLPIDKRLGKVRTEYIVYGVAVIAQVAAQALMHGFHSFAWAFIPKCIAYAFLVAVTAKEVYNKAIGNVEAKKAALCAKAEETPSIHG